MSRARIRSPPSSSLTIISTKETTPSTGGAVDSDRKEGGSEIEDCICPLIHQQNSVIRTPTFHSNDFNNLDRVSNLNPFQPNESRDNPVLDLW
mmetsp:Transcript_24243/g.53420  ORF Transcript_24243/g.53420 Transcript_24243/m.53420 type:complete len:93 (-) Transcript_24243:1374-1652(-)